MPELAQVGRTQNETADSETLGNAGGIEAKVEDDIGQF